MCVNQFQVCIFNIHFLVNWSRGTSVVGAGRITGNNRGWKKQKKWLKKANITQFNVWLADKSLALNKLIRVEIRTQFIQ